MIIVSVSLFRPEVQNKEQKLVPLPNQAYSMVSGGGVH